MTGMFPTGGCQQLGSVLRCLEYSTPRMLRGDALLLAQGLKIQAWRRLLFGMGVFKIE